MRSLDVEFRGGDTYRYFNVSKSIYGELLKAESAGAYWNEVKDKFTYVKLDEDRAESHDSGGTVVTTRKIS